MNEAARSLDTIDQMQRETCERLAREPAIARVIAQDEDGNREVYFISRAAAPPPFMAGVKFASYRSPAGRLAALPPGDWAEIRRPSETVVLEVVERTLLTPEELPEGWDSLDTLFETEAFGPVTIDSLRRLLSRAQTVDDVEDVFAALLRDEETRLSVSQGRRKSIINKMELRDQPVLDRFQDEIFRLPLDSRVVLLGPPGSGKTTTLIRRLGQKLDLGNMEPDEVALVDQLAGLGGEPHATSWMMFTPTELLRVYVKEAFARENIAASDRRIRTWSSHRLELARETFSILRTSDGGGPFVLRDDEPTILPEALTGSIAWFEDFDAWQADLFWDELAEAANQLGQDNDREVAAIGTRLFSGVARARKTGDATGLFALIDLLSEVRALLERSRTTTDTRLRMALNLQINRNRGFLEELGSHIDQLGDSTDDDQDDEDTEVEDDEPPRAQMPTLRVANAYLTTLRAQARAAASGRRPRGRPAAILRWLGERALPESDLLPIGRELSVQRALARFSNPVRTYIRGVPRRYRSFRRLRREEGRWYQTARAGRYVNGLEVDIVLLSTLTAASTLLRDRRSARIAGTPGLATLDRFASLLRNQVFVDEATDFSAVQLSCMAALAHPGSNSFFACGDFNQRITTWGASDIEQLRWVHRDFDVREIAIAYRQSRQLLELAARIAESTGERAILATLPEHVNNEGVAPVLATGLAGLPATIEWLKARVVEIESAVKPQPLPTIAVLVNSENSVRPVAELLNAALEEHNLRAVACTDGRIMGLSNEVRVFDVQHIKGLEFEAVFFLGIDQLAERDELFDRFLYVGATRAATYLGITCDGDLPPRIAHLADSFGTDWR